MWLFMLKTDQGEIPILLDEREPSRPFRCEWRRVAHVSSRDEVYDWLGSYREPSYAPL